MQATVGQRTATVGPRQPTTANEQPMQATVGQQTAVLPDPMHPAAPTHTWKCVLQLLVHVFPYIPSLERHVRSRTCFSYVIFFC